MSGTLETPDQRFVGVFFTDAGEARAWTGTDRFGQLIGTRLVHKDDQHEDVEHELGRVYWTATLSRDEPDPKSREPLISGNFAPTTGGKESAPRLGLFISRLGDLVLNDGEQHALEVQLGYDLYNLTGDRVAISRGRIEPASSGSGEGPRFIADEFVPANVEEVAFIQRVLGAVFAQAREYAE